MPEPKAGDLVTVDGKQYKLTPCNKCSKLIYFIKDEQTQKWKLFNADGSRHDEPGRSFSRPPSLKFSVGVVKVVNSISSPTVRVEMTMEFLKAETTPDQAFAEVNKKVTEWVQKEAAAR